MSIQTKVDRLQNGNAKIGCLLNPLSGQVRKRQKQIRQVFNHQPELTLHEASDTDSFKAAVDHLLQADVDLLVLVAGDGTTLAVLGHLFAKSPPSEWPLLMLIPGGTTNMTSLDLGVHGKPDQVLQRIRDYIQSPSTPKLVQRPAICIEQAGTENIYGMFFAVGLVARGVKFSRSSVKQLGITGGIFTFLIMLRSLFGMLFGRSQSDQSEWAPVKMAITDQNGKTCQGTYLFALISALDCLLLNIRPYWGTQQAPLHVTLVDQQRKRLWRSLWPLLSGRGHTLKEIDGYYSHNTASLSLKLDDEYIVDGELFRSISEKEPLRISATAPITFLVL